jgi:membrane protein implicated in regulation of membrane protease activity/uncharacterized protein YlzI (FlbEa/FlbD family)
MKKLFFVFIACLTLSTLLNSCSIEKRLHQDGYHISWSHRLFSNKNEGSYEIAKKKIVDHDIYSTENSIDQNPVNLPPEPNNHSVETISANTSETLTLSARKKSIVNSPIDTITPKEETKQEEYFSNNYTNPLPTNELQDTKLANWALGLGIGAVSSPLWVTLLFLLLFALVGATWSGVSAWTALGLAIIVGGGIFITLEILAITFAIRFLRMHGKDPNYRKYRSRAITGLILAGIYPAIMLLNIIIGLAMI